MTDRDDDQQVEPAWHQRTSTLAGASAAGVVVLALLYLLISTVAREFGDTAPVQQYFLDPSTSGTASFTEDDTTTTTTQTITSTSPPVTSDIDDPNAPTTTSSTDTSTTSPTQRRPPRTRDDDPTTTRSRPRLNETRTLYPQP